MMDDAARSMLERAIGDGRQEFGSFFLSRLFGFEISYEGERCSVTFEVVPQMLNPQGSLHGGVLATALDVSMGHLLHHCCGAGITLEMKVQYFAPVRAGLVRCQGSFLKKGRKTLFLQSHATGPDGDLVAHATSTWKLL
jgi:uncharacterized protein (TIGR00369 family)